MYETDPEPARDDDGLEPDDLIGRELAARGSISSSIRSDLPGLSIREPARTVSNKLSIADSVWIALFSRASIS